MGINVYYRWLVIDITSLIPPCEPEFIYYQKKLHFCLKYYINNQNKLMKILNVTISFLFNLFFFFVFNFSQYTFYAFVKKMCKQLDLYTAIEYKYYSWND